MEQKSLLNEFIPGSREELDFQTLRKMRSCGHFLHFYTGGKGGQRRILTMLLEYETLTQRELQELLDVRSASISEILLKMENDGLILREKSPEDRRQIRLTLTDRGRKVGREKEAVYQQLIFGMFSCLDEAEERQFLESITKLWEHWCDMKQGEEYKEIFRCLNADTNDTT